MWRLLCRGHSRVQGCPSEKQLFFQVVFFFFPTLQLHEGSLKGFIFFKEFNSLWLIFLSVMNFHPPTTCFVLRTPGPAGEAPQPQGQGWKFMCWALGVSVCSSTAGAALLSHDLTPCLPAHQVLGMEHWMNSVPHQ